MHEDEGDLTQERGTNEAEECFLIFLRVYDSLQVTSFPIQYICAKARKTEVSEACWSYNTFRDQIRTLTPSLSGKRLWVLMAQIVSPPCNRPDKKAFGARAWRAPWPIALQRKRDDTVTLSFSLQRPPPKNGTDSRVSHGFSIGPAAMPPIAGGDACFGSTPVVRLLPFTNRIQQVELHPPSPSLKRLATSGSLGLDMKRSPKNVQLI